MMLIIGMTLEQMQKQVSDDYLLLSRYLDSLSGRFRYWADRAKDGESTSVHWKSKNNNQWETILVKCKNEVSMVSFTWIESSAGRFVFKAQMTLHGYVLLIFIPHFFRRYRERMNLGSKISPMQIIKRYLKKNRSGHTTYKGDGKMEITFEEGVGLGLVLGLRTRLIKTFITYDMAFDNQMKRFNESEEHRKMYSEFGYYNDEAMAEMRMLGISDKEALDVMKEKYSDLFTKKEQ